MIEKILLFIFIFCSLFAIREVLLFAQRIIRIRNSSDDEIEPYRIGFLRIFGVGISLSYIITKLIVGF